MQKSVWAKPQIQTIPLDFIIMEQRRVEQRVGVEQRRVEVRDPKQEATKPIYLLCEVCGKSGHSADECRHRCTSKACIDSGDVHDKLGCPRKVPCEECGKRGHLPSECWKREDKKLKCSSYLFN